MPPSQIQTSMRTELTAEVLRRFGFARIRVQGSSMLPSLRPGDEIEVLSCSVAQVNQGDIVACRRDDRLFVHRVASVNPLVTRGDALSEADAPVAESEFLGTVARVQRNGERIDPRPSFANLASAAIFRRSRFCAAIFVKTSR